MYPACLVLACLLAHDAAKPARIAPDFAMESDPLLVPPTPIVAFSDKYLPLWLQALDRPDADLQRLAAETIALARRDGVPHLEQAIPTLVKIVSAKEAQPAPRFAAARALIALEAKQAAAPLWEASQHHGSDLRQLVEPALARWKYQPAYETWRKRLPLPETPHRDLLLAIASLGEVQDESSIPRLLAIVHDPLRPVAARLAAASSAGRFKEHKLAADAQQLAEAAPRINRLCAVALLERQEGKAAQDILLRLAVDQDPSIAGPALDRLSALDLSLILPLAEQSLRSPDAGVRRPIARAYATLPTTERIPLLAQILNDPDPSIREMVREDLHRLARQAPLADPVRKAAVDLLSKDNWRGQEQAALLLAALDYKPVAPRLVELLESPRGEVMIASAWGLRKLAVKETLPAMLDKATRQTEVRLANQTNYAPLDVQVAHLCEGLALMKYAPADPLFRRYIPKDYTMGELSRGAAIWGLGYLHAGQPDDKLAAAIAGRVTEPSMALPPEMGRVRLAGTIALGRMKARSQADTLRKNASGFGTNVYLAMRWTLKEITGEALPEARSPIVSKSGWFLEPVESPSEPAAAAP